MPKQSEDEQVRGGTLSRDIYDESLRPTEIHSELDAASIQLQSQGVCWLFGGGGHEQAIRPLRHEAQWHVLGLRVHGDRHDDLKVHAAVITQHRCLCKRVKERTGETEWLTHWMKEDACRGKNSDKPRLYAWRHLKLFPEVIIYIF